MDYQHQGATHAEFTGVTHWSDTVADQSLVKYTGQRLNRSLDFGLAMTL